MPISAAPPMSISPAPSQANYTNQQTFDIDINKFYDEIVTAIDQVRSHVSISKSAQALSQMIQALSSKAKTGFSPVDPYVFLKQLVTDPTNPQETRCSAFYRLLGLPVIEPTGGLLFSPGYDINQNTLQDLPAVSQLHLNVMTKIPKALYTLMDNREVYTNSILSIFSLSNQSNTFPNINASILALSSVANGTVRKFSASTSQSSDPFNSSVFSQSYFTSNQSGQVYNSAGTAQLANRSGTAGYLDQTNNYATIGTLNNIAPLNQSPLFCRAHIIRPLMTDPRVNLSINPPNGLVCAPFAIDKSKTRYSQDIYLTRPYIDVICSYRCNAYQNQTNQGAQSKSYQDLLAYIKNTNTERNPDLLSQLAQDISTTTDQLLVTYVNIMNSMVNILWEAIQKVRNAEAPRTGHQWIPIPNVQGPEYGSVTPDVFLINSPAGAILDPIILANYPRDQDIISKTVQTQLQNVTLLSQLSQTQEPDLGNFAFQGVPTAPDPKSTESFGSVPQQSLDDSIKARTTVCNKAADALRTIEIIMGEFSGFGLCDILAIFAALWTVDEEILVGMLDDKAFARLYSNPNLRDSVVQARYVAGSGPDGRDVLKAFDAQVSQMYVLQDKLFADVSGANTSGS